MDPYVRTHVNDALLVNILRFQRTRPYYKISRRRCMYRSKEECPSGVDCPLHGDPVKARELLLKILEEKQKLNERYYHSELLRVATAKSPSLGPPYDDSIKTIYVSGLDERINEQDLRVNFFAHGEIETLKMVIARKFAVVTYKTREGAAKAGEELPNRLYIKGLRLNLMWHKPPAPKPGYEASDEARQQAVGSQSGLLPSPVISKQKYHVLQPSGFEDQAPELPPPQQRVYCPSLDTEIMGAFIPSQEGSSSG